MTPPFDSTGEGEGAHGLTPPPRVEVTTEWLNEQRRKQRAYEKSRDDWRRHFDHPDDPEDTANDFASAPDLVKARGRRRAYDKRQLKLDF
jgi:hypothetical protein